MKKKQLRNYVIKNAGFMEDAPKTPYFVRFPHPYGGKVFFSDDTLDLFEQVYKYSKTKEGREMGKNRDWSGYDDLPEEVEDEFDTVSK